MICGIIMALGPCGLRCPAETEEKKCNQIKCPVDCVILEWSEYSKRITKSGIKHRVLEPKDQRANAWLSRQRGLDPRPTLRGVTLGVP